MLPGSAWKVFGQLENLSDQNLNDPSFGSLPMPETAFETTATLAIGTSNSTSSHSIFWYVQNVYILKLISSSNAPTQQPGIYTTAV
jgi:hypothetical protein